MAVISGELVTMFPTGHAFGIRSPEGIEVLVHIGLNTVEMEGEGFQAHKNQGDKVNAGEKIVTFDLDLCQREGKSIISPVVLTNMEIVKKLTGKASGEVVSGKTSLFEAEL